MIKSALIAVAVFFMVSQAMALEPARSAIVNDIEYETLEDTAKFRIKANSDIEYITYELENPYRIIIDPLQNVWCDFEEEIYFDEGLVRSVRFVKGKDVPDGPGLPYYPFDFVAVELKYPYPYDLSEDEYMITLMIGEREKETLPVMEAKAPVVKPPKKKVSKKEPPKKKTPKRKPPKKKVSKRQPPAPKKKPYIATKKLKKERSLLEKEKKALAKQKIRLSKVETRLERDREKLNKKKEEFKKEKIKKLEPRPKGYFKGEVPPPDYLGKMLALEDCINVAVSNSLSIETAEKKVKVAKLKVNEAFRELFPEVTFMLDESRGKISNEHYIGRKLGFEFKQPIFHGGELMGLWEQSKVNLKLAKENLSKEKENIIFNVSKAYYDLVKAINKDKLQKELLEYIKGDFEIAEKELVLDLMTKIDFMNIESAVNQVRHTLVVYDNSLALARLELNKAMNVNVDTTLEVEAELELKDMDIDPEKCVDMALKFRPEYRIGTLNIEIAKFTERIARSQTYPQIDVFGKYLKSRELLEPTFESLDNRLKNERVIGATVSVPIGPHTIDYQKKRTKLAPTVTTFGSNTESDVDKYRLSLFDNMDHATNLQDAKAEYKQALDDLNKAEQDIHTDIRQALFSLVETKIKMKNSQSNMDLYKKEIEVARIRKGMNDISFYELIQAKAKLFGEKTLYTDALGDYYIAVARINKAIGIGGYFN